MKNALSTRMSPRCSIVVRAYNESKHIGRLMVGIHQQTVTDTEVILVDSGSNDGTPEIAEEMGAKVFHIAKHDFSFGRALNLGCEQAKGNYLLIASAHVYPVYKTWVEEMLTPMIEDPKVELVYGMQRGGSSTKFSEHCLFRSWYPNEACPDQKTPFSNNANAAVRRATWQELKYDESLPGLEDIAWAIEMKRRVGGKITYQPTARVIHVHEETWAQVRNRYFREGLALRHIEPNSRFGLGSLLGLTWRNALGDARAAYGQGVLASELGGIILFRLNQFLGTYYAHRSATELTESLRRRLYYPGTEGDQRPVEVPKNAPLVEYD